MSELKPCPFCGHTEVELVGAGDNWLVGCKNGKCMGFVTVTDTGFGNKEIAIAAWNRRADENNARDYRESPPQMDKHR